MKYILILSCALLFAGCAQKVELPADRVVKQEILLERCSFDTPLPEQIVVDKHGNSGYSGKEVLDVLRKWDSIYNDCALKHDALIDLIRKLQGENITVIIKE